MGSSIFVLPLLMSLGTFVYGVYIARRNRSGRGSTAAVAVGIVFAIAGAALVIFFGSALVLDSGAY